MSFLGYVIVRGNPPSLKTKLFSVVMSCSLINAVESNPVEQNRVLQRSRCMVYIVIRQKGSIQPSDVL